MRRHSPVMVTAIIFWVGTALLAVKVVIASGVPSLNYSAPCMDRRCGAGIVRYR
jgi:hypothetical protein